MTRNWPGGGIGPRHCRAETDKALVGDFGFNLGRWGSYGEWFYGIAADPDYTRAWYDLKIENLLANVERYAQAVGDNIDVVWLMEDFGTQKGMMISPQMFERDDRPLLQAILPLDPQQYRLEDLFPFLWWNLPHH